MKKFFYVLLLISGISICAFGQKTINVSTAGTLSTLLGETEKYSVEELTVTGTLNGTDLALLREMAGNDSHGNLTAGKLRVLNLSGATMVAGGDKYLDTDQITIDEGYNITNGTEGFHFDAVKDAIPDWAFGGCNSLQEISMPAGLTGIGPMAFFTLNLRKVTFPKGLRIIGARAFYHNIHLETLQLPASLQEIGDRAFGYCTDLKSVDVYWATPLSIPDRLFMGVTAKLNVPKGTKALYEAADVWKDFDAIVETEEEPQPAIDAKVKLSKTKAIIEKGKTLTLKATITPSDLPDKSVTWKSSNTKVATVSSKGKVKGVKAGTATITCTSKATGAKATCKVTIGYVKLDKTEAILEKTKTMTLKATVYPSKLEDRTVTWESSNKKVATVSSKGKVKGVKAGTATITCTSNATGLKTTCEVTVGYVKLDQTEVTVNKGKTVTLKATVYPSSLEDRTVTWESSNTKVATVTSKGKVKGVKSGTATITCTSNATGLSTTCIVTVTTTASILSLEGGNKDGVTEIDEVETSVAIEPFDVYDLSGRKVLHQVTSLDGLPDGIYIVNGKKILKKK